MSTRDTREAILDAAERVLRSKGLVGASTRQIAREVGCADGTLYVHFRDRTELFLALLLERVPRLSAPLRNLPNRVGRRTVRANLEEVAIAALELDDHIVPLFGALFAEPELLASYRARHRERRGGPHRAVDPVAAYLREEQREARVNRSADVDAAAGALMYGCLGHAFARLFIGEERSVDRERALAKKLVAMLWHGLAPDPPAPGDDSEP